MFSEVGRCKKKSMEVQQRCILWVLMSTGLQVQVHSVLFHYGRRLLSRPGQLLPAPHQILNTLLIDLYEG